MIDQVYQIAQIRGNRGMGLITLLPFGLVLGQGGDNTYWTEWYGEINAQNQITLTTNTTNPPSLTAFNLATGQGVIQILDEDRPVFAYMNGDVIEIDGTRYVVMLAPGRVPGYTLTPATSETLPTLNSYTSSNAQVVPLAGGGTSLAFPMPAECPTEAASKGVTTPGWVVICMRDGTNTNYPQGTYWYVKVDNINEFCNFQGYSNITSNVTNSTFQNVYVIETFATPPYNLTDVTDFVDAVNLGGFVPVDVTTPAPPTPPPGTGQTLVFYMTPNAWDTLARFFMFPGSAVPAQTAYVKINGKYYKLRRLRRNGGAGAELPGFALGTDNYYIIMAEAIEEADVPPGTQVPELTHGDTATYMGGGGTLGLYVGEGQAITPAINAAVVAYPGQPTLYNGLNIDLYNETDINYALNQPIEATAKTQQGVGCSVDDLLGDREAQGRGDAGRDFPPTGGGGKKKKTLNTSTTDDPCWIDRRFIKNIYESRDESGYEERSIYIF